MGASWRTLGGGGGVFQNITMSSQTRAFTLASFPSKYCDNMTLEVAKASEEIRTETLLLSVSPPPDVAGAGGLGAGGWWPAGARRR